MAAGDTLSGTRCDDVPDSSQSHPRMASPGSYRRTRYRDGDWSWEAVTPNGHRGNLASHDVEEHEDGTITVSPSILVQGGAGESWHGYLEHGIWREV